MLGLSRVVPPSCILHQQRHPALTAVFCHRRYTRSMLTPTGTMAQSKSARGPMQQRPVAQREGEGVHKTTLWIASFLTDEKRRVRLDLLLSNTWTGSYCCGRAKLDSRKARRTDQGVMTFCPPDPWTTFGAEESMATSKD